jgi:hypothetical protein
MAAVKPTARSRITNGKALFVGVDGRSRQARRFRDIYRDLLEQTGGRSEALVRSIAGLCVQRELIESRLARGEPVDTAELVSVAGAISRLATKIGILDEESEDVTDLAIANNRAVRESGAGR